MSQEIRLECQVSTTSSGSRFDQVAAEMFPQYSRARLQSWIRAGDLRLGGKVVKPNVRVLGGEKVALTTYLQPEGEWQAQALDLDIVFEDEHLLVINKSAGLVVHPAAGNPDGTVLNALLHHAPEVESVPRAGIVHRLDKDTTGLMVVAKTLEAQNQLVKQLQARTVSRQYDAVTMGAIRTGGTVDAPIGRHPRQRKKMAVVNIGGKEAVTHYRVIAQLGDFTHVRVKLETGRTHQIRVHMAHIRHPLVGDPVYGGRPKLSKGLDVEIARAVRDFPRQALHAAQLGLVHPASGKSLQWRVPLPDDMSSLLALLEDATNSAWDDDL
jgi:23S rRNA pseudouridine1911/1915/1917 synthase